MFYLGTGTGSVGQRGRHPFNLKTAVARAESSQGPGIMTAYRGGTDHLFGYAPRLCAALILKPLANLQHAQLPFSGSI